MKYIRFFILASILPAAAWLQAQNPKWFKKARKAQISIVTFNAQGDTLASGNGFFIDKRGVALANFKMFEGAHRALVTDFEKRTYDVVHIQGANSLYDVVKFDLGSNVKVNALEMATDSALTGETVYVLPDLHQERKRCRVDTVRKAVPFDENRYVYYTLSGKSDEKKTNCPVLNREGKVIGMLQAPADADDPNSYAICPHYGADLKINGLSFADSDLQAIFIRKALPDNEDMAATFIYMANQGDSISYTGYLKEYIETYPKSPTGYTLLAEYFALKGNHEQAEQVYDQAIEHCREKDEIYYSQSRLFYNLNLNPNYKLYKDWTMQRALTMAESAEKENNLPIYLQQQGHCLYALKEYEKAYDKYMALTKTNLRSADAFLYAAQCKRMAGASQEEILSLQDSALACYSKPYPDDAATILIDRANTLMSLKRYRQAVADYNEYERLMYGKLSANFYYQKSQCELQSRMYQQALDDIDRAASMEPETALFHAEKAVICYKVGMIVEAIEAAQKCIETDPEFTDAYRILGICLIQSDKKADGMKFLQKAADMGDSIAPKLIEEIK